MRLCRPDGANPTICGTPARRGRGLVFVATLWISLAMWLTLATKTHAETRWPAEPSNPLWTSEQVATWAAQTSPAAQLMESERAAAAATIDRDDPQQCARASLKQSVMADFAQHERCRASADALEAYFRIVGLSRQRQLAVEATSVVDRLIAMADQAVTLGLSSQDSGELLRKKLVTEDQIAQIDGGVEKLRLQLAQLTGRSVDLAGQAILISPLRGGDLIPPNEVAIATALEQRADLRALRTICRRLSAATLPTARELLSVQQPGLGLASQVTTQLLLPCFRGPDRSAGDLRLRRQQCHQVSQARADQIELEVRARLVDLSTARRRSALADQRVRSANSSIDKIRASIDLNQATPGADLLIKLESLAAEGDRLLREIDESVGWVRLEQAQGQVGG